jgi:hypothetical protein
MQVQILGSYTGSRIVACWVGFGFWSNVNIVTSVTSTAKWNSSETDGYCHVCGVAWRKIVSSRFEDWIYWTSLLQLQLITAFNTFLIKNLSLHFFWTSDWSLVFSVELSIGPNIGHQVEQFIFLLFAVAMETCCILSWFLGIDLHRNVCLFVAEGTNAYPAIVRQQTFLLCFSDCALPVSGFTSQYFSPTSPKPVIIFLVVNWVTELKGEFLNICNTYYYFANT